MATIQNTHTRLRMQYIGVCTLLGRIAGRLPKHDENHYGIEKAMRDANNLLLVEGSDIYFQQLSNGDYAAFERSQLSMTATSTFLLAQGYRLVDNANNEHGRLTFMHDDNADRPFLLALSHSLRYRGWQTDDAVPPVYRLPSAKLMIEIEPGGADTSGHYLHLIHTAD